MTRFLLIGLLMGAGAWSARAEEDAAAATDNAVAMRFVHLDFEQSRGRVQEYDGKLYRDMHGDVKLANQGKQGLFDFSLKDIGSTEENGVLNADYQDNLRISAKVDTMHHRQDYARTGIILKGAWQPTTHFTTVDIATTTEFVVRRTESDIDLILLNPENAAQWLSAEFWTVEKFGSMAARAPGTASGTATLGSANVNNTKRDVIIGLGTNINEYGAVSLDIVHSEFKDDSNTSKDTHAINSTLKPIFGAQQMTGAELKFRQDMGKDLGLTGALTGRQRENLSNGYKRNTIVGALNAAYKARQNLSLSGKLYLNAYQVEENSGYVSPIGNKGNGSQMDKTNLKGDFNANYRPVEAVRLTAAYKIEIDNRRDHGDYNEGTVGYYSDGTLVLPNGQNTQTAHSDVRHNFRVGAKAELPFGIEADADYKRLQANHSSFGNQNNRQNDASLTITVPLPQRVDMVLATEYMDGTGSQMPWNHAESRNDYRASLNWAATNKVCVGADTSYETIRYFTNGFIGNAAATLVAAQTSPIAWHEGGMSNRQKNTVVGGHGRINLPMGFVVLGNGSYTWSKEETPMHWASTVGAVGDYTPRDIRIARGSVTVEYTPPKYKHLSARAGYRIDNWVDKFDSSNSGRASVVNAGVNVKF